MILEADDIIDRQIQIIRYSNGLVSRISRLNQDHDKLFLSNLMEWQSEITDADKNSLLRSDQRNPRVSKLLTIFNNYKKTQYLEGKIFLFDELNEVISKQITRISKIISREDEELEKDLNETSVASILILPVLGFHIAGNWKSVNEYWYKMTWASILKSVLEDLDAALNLKGTNSLNLKDGLFYSKYRSIETHIINTILGAVSNVNRQLYIKAGIEKEEWLATLDDRTCVICATNEIEGPYLLNKGPQPLEHPKCRCIRVPHDPDNKFERPYVKDHRSVKDIPFRERKDKIGRSYFSYKEFFERRPDSAKLRILRSKTRFDLYKSGEYEIEDFVNDKTNQIYSISQLEELSGLL